MNSSDETRAIHAFLALGQTQRYLVANFWSAFIAWLIANLPDLITIAKAVWKIIQKTFGK